MGRRFEELSLSGEKVGEASPALTAQLLALKEQQRRQQVLSEEEEGYRGREEEDGGEEGDSAERKYFDPADTSCSVEEEGQSQKDHSPILSAKV